MLFYKKTVENLRERINFGLIDRNDIGKTEKINEKTRNEKMEKVEL